MKQNKLEIQINKSPKEVFEFLLNPQNMPKWIETTIKEETNEWPTKLGSLYRNYTLDPQVDGKTISNEYQITEFEENKLFTLKKLNSSYYFKYSFEPVNEGTKLIYYESVDEGELEDPLTDETLQKLKTVIEGAESEDQNKQKAIMIELTRYTMKKDKSDRVDDWMKLIRDNAKTRQDEEVRENERMLIETIFRQKESENEYLYWFHIQGENPSNLTASDYEVDKKHLEFAKECTEPGSKVDMDLEVTMILDRIRELLN